jgi:nucleotide-binding universal stress UspA family protein
MKKILLLFNGIHSPALVLTEAIAIARFEGANLQGIFINRLKIPQEFGYLFPNDLALVGSDYTPETEASESRRLVEANMQLFKDECELSGIPCQVSFYAETSVELLVQQSAYADLIIADTQTQFDDYALSDVLSGAHCPVYLVTTNAGQIDRVILAYDGSLNSMYAIKQYAYLFPKYASIPTYLLSIQEVGGLKQESDLSSWLSLHFREVKTEMLHGKAKDALVLFVGQGAQNTLVVMGAFGRSALSRWMRESLAEVIIKETQASLLITHL